jgi:SnoaL-like domain
VDSEQVSPSEIARELSEVLNRYVMALDSMSEAQLRDVLAPDIVFAGGVRGDSEPVRAAGRDQVVEYLLSSRAAAGSQTRHIVSNLIVDDLVSGAPRFSAYLLFCIVAQGHSSPRATGVYRGATVRHERRLRLSELTLELDAPY